MFHVNYRGLEYMHISKSIAIQYLKLWDKKLRGIKNNIIKYCEQLTHLLHVILIKRLNYVSSPSFTFDPYFRLVTPLSFLFIIFLSFQLIMQEWTVKIGLLCYIIGFLPYHIAPRQGATWILRKYGDTAASIEYCNTSVGERNEWFRILLIIWWGKCSLCLFMPHTLNRVRQIGYKTRIFDQIKTVLFQDRKWEWVSMPISLHSYSDCVHCYIYEHKIWNPNYW